VGDPAVEVEIHVHVPWVTVKLTTLLPEPQAAETWTDFCPKDVQGTVPTMDVSDQEIGVAVTLSNGMMVEPTVTPNPLPDRVNVVPTVPLVGVIPEIAGVVDRTVKSVALLAWPHVVTCTAFTPAVKPQDGTVTMMDVPDQELGVRAVPPKVTVLLPCVEPKPLPEIVTIVESTIAPLSGAIPEITDWTALTVMFTSTDEDRRPSLAVTVTVCVPLSMHFFVV